LDKHETPVMSAQNALKLGIFGINMRGGVTLASFDGMVAGTWEENVRLAQHADRIGIDAIVPVARWRGYGGRENLGDVSFETFTWAAGLLALTRRIMVFSTFHVPLGHPVLAAKLGSTVDHISGGRWGLNIVSGWNPEELAMFGVTLREHDERYDVADEWAALLKQLWTAPGESAFHGRHFDIDRACSDPKPRQHPYPVIMNAGTSPAGREFAARHSDLIYAGLTNYETAADQIREIKTHARERHGRELRVFGRAHIVCRDTEAQAQREYARLHRELADVDGARNVVRLNLPNSQSADWETIDMQRILEGMIAGFWAIPVIGTPDQVTERLLELHAAGCDGISLSWPSFEEGLTQMEDEIRPRLVQAGVRTPAAV
jgi:alkanesulfonate monooxygenase SsuD/methylene tetrahydromethanopterin reductase-like flavin-dependent oxidoreductase (luciferase family)